ncbi:1174_t:CDS:2, partial [Gigaspora margarita]
MLLSQPKIPEVGSEFSTVKSLKVVVQQNTKATDYAFNENQNDSGSKATLSQKIEVLIAKEAIIP